MYTVPTCSPAIYPTAFGGLPYTPLGKTGSPKRRVCPGKRARDSKARTKGTATPCTTESCRPEHCGPPRRDLPLCAMECKTLRQDRRTFTRARMETWRAPRDGKVRTAMLRVRGDRPGRAGAGEAFPDVGDGPAQGWMAAGRSYIQRENDNRPPRLPGCNAAICPSASGHTGDHGQTTGTGSA
jgi:hypothetical protein